MDSTQVAAMLAAFASATTWEIAPPDVEQALLDAVKVACDEWPTLDVSVVEFARAVGAAVGDAEAPAAAVSGLHAADLWLACACARGDAVAVEALDERLRALRPTLLRMGASEDDIDEVLQGLRVTLLVSGEHRPARIRGYRGRGELRNWLKVAVVRDGVRAIRRRVDRPQAIDEVDLLMDPGGDPEHDRLKGSYAASFRAAFRVALDALSPRERNILRYHLVDKLTIDELGAVYRVHRSTAARWLSRIREGLFISTRADLMARLALSEHELDSVLRIIGSRLDASITDHLRT